MFEEIVGESIHQDLVSKSSVILVFLAHRRALTEKVRSIYFHAICLHLLSFLFLFLLLFLFCQPTNHLDLEAVLWLQSYLQTYQHTVLLVSHDRSFLNEVCTDVMLFKNLKLNYFKGNYDAFESTDKEMKLVQQRQHESQMVKVQHMQVN